MRWIKIFENESSMESRLPEKLPKKLVIGTRNICITRIEDKVYAFSNSCPHMGETLHKGKINIHNEMVCPLHGYQFNLITGQESNSKCNNLIKYKIKSDKTGVLIGLPD